MVEKSSTQPPIRVGFASRHREGVTVGACVQRAWRAHCTMTTCVAHEGNVDYCLWACSAIASTPRAAIVLELGLYVHRVHKGPIEGPRVVVSSVFSFSFRWEYSPCELACSKCYRSGHRVTNAKAYYHNNPPQNNK